MTVTVRRNHLPAVNRLSVVGFVAVLLIALGWAPGAAEAGGIRVKKWLTLPELVKDSKIIVVGRVLKISHNYNGRRCYGKRIIYMSVFRVQIKVERVVRGPQKLKGRKVMLIKRIWGVPGRMVLVPKLYGSKLGDVGKIRVGCRFIAFTLDDGRPTLTLGDGKPALQIPPRRSTKTIWIRAFALEHLRLLKNVTRLARKK